MFSSFTKNLNYKPLLFPFIASFSLLKLHKLNTKSSTLHCGSSHSEEDDSKISAGKTLNHKILKIEQKLDYLLNKESSKITSKDFPKFSKENSSLLKKILDESVWRRNHMLLTEEGFNINDIIQAGIDNQDHPIGIVSPSKDAYFTFEEIFVNAASNFHNRNIRLTKYDKENYAMIKNILNTTEDFLNKIISSIEISTNRNVEGHNFSSKISRSNRRELARNILHVLKSEESQIFEENGKFLSLENNKDLFSSEKQNPFYRSCGIYRDWPDGRFIYVNNEQTLHLVVNEEDHIKIIQKNENFAKNSENNSTTNIVKYLLNYYDLLDKLHNKLTFTYDENLGFLNSFLNNVGSGCYYRVSVKVPKEKIEEFKNHFKNNSDLEIKVNGEDVEVSNNTSYYNFSQFLVDLVSAKNILQ
jgi:hypothetical protein